MTWFLFAVLATILMTIVNFGDKFIVESQVPNPLALIIFLSWFNLLVALILWVSVGFAVIPLTQGLLLIVAGTAPALAGYFYFQAVVQTEATRIVILSQTTPVFTLILSVIFRNELLDATQVIGFALILIAAIGVTLQRQDRNVTETIQVQWHVLMLMVVSNLIYAISLVLTDNLVENLITDIHSLTIVTAYSAFGYWVGGILLLVFIPNVRRAFVGQLRHTGVKAIISLSSVEFVFVLRQFVLFMALTLGPVSLVSVIGSLNVFVAIVFGWILTLWQPHIFKEDISRDSLLRKFMWASVAFVGIFLLN